MSQMVSLVAAPAAALAVAPAAVPAAALAVAPVAASGGVQYFSRTA